MVGPNPVGLVSLKEEEIKTHGCTHAEQSSREDMLRRRTSASQGKKPQKKWLLPTP